MPFFLYLKKNRTTLTGGSNILKMGRIFNTRVDPLLIAASWTSFQSKFTRAAALCSLRERANPFMSFTNPRRVNRRREYVRPSDRLDAATKRGWPVRVADRPNCAGSLPVTNCPAPNRAAAQAPAFFALGSKELLTRWGVLSPLVALGGKFDFSLNATSNRKCIFSRGRSNKRGWLGPTIPPCSGESAAKKFTGVNFIFDLLLVWVFGWGSYVFAK